MRGNLVVGNGTVDINNVAARQSWTLGDTNDTLWVGSLVILGALLYVLQKMEQSVVIAGEKGFTFGLNLFCHGLES